MGCRSRGRNSFFPPSQHVFPIWTMRATWVLLLRHPHCATFLLAYWRDSQPLSSRPPPPVAVAPLLVANVLACFPFDSGNGSVKSCWFIPSAGLLEKPFEEPVTAQERLNSPEGPSCCAVIPATPDGQSTSCGLFPPLPNPGRFRGGTLSTLIPLAFLDWMVTVMPMSRPCPFSVRPGGLGSANMPPPSWEPLGANLTVKPVAKMGEPNRLNSGDGGWRTKLSKEGGSSRRAFRAMR